MYVSGVDDDDSLGASWNSAVSIGSLAGRNLGSGGQNHVLFYILPNRTSDLLRILIGDLALVGLQKPCSHLADDLVD